MFRQRALSLTIFSLILTSLACNAFAGSLQPLPPPPTAVADQISNDNSIELVATVTMPASSPLETGSVTVLVDLNVRSGPGVNYDRVGFLLKNEIAPIIGVHTDTGWWKIACPADVTESECWVSGGEQYTRAEEVGSVAEAGAPPTPTPVPPTLEQGLGILAFIDNGMLFAATLDLSKNPPQLADDPIQLASMANVQSISISPDGRRIAFISGTSETNSIQVVNMDGQDLRTLAISAELPFEAGQVDTDFALLIDQMAWLPDSVTLAFNTIAVNLVGPGSPSQEDLWTVTLDGELLQPFPAGLGGGAFALTTNDQVLLSRSNNIARANMDGSNSEEILQFELINTASEYIYYPLPQIIDGGERVVYIPDGQPWQPEALTNLWRIPRSGGAFQLGTVEGNTLFDPVQWSPDGSRLAFVQQPADPDTTALSTLMIADGNGLDANPFVAGDALAFHAWSPDNENFLYSGNGFYAVGRENSPAVQSLLSPGQRVNDAQWMAEKSFIVAEGFPENGSWDLISATVSGENTSLLSLRGFGASFDVWLP